MHINELRESKFLKKEDCGNGVLLTIRKIFQENIAKEGAPPEMKWCVEFDEIEKPMVLNSTNGQLIAQITGSEDTDNWTGRKIVLYLDPSVSFGGKIVGGIRARAPRGKAAETKSIIATNLAAAQAAEKAKTLPPPEEDDQVPF